LALPGLAVSHLHDLPGFIVTMHTPHSRWMGFLVAPFVINMTLCLFVAFLGSYRPLYSGPGFKEMSSFKADHPLGEHRQIFIRPGT
jgi:hypothetical protein